jgi:hypothetical protein
MAAALAATTLNLDVSLGTASPGSPAEEANRRGVAYFEPPRSIGTPLEDLVRTYSGQALADRIAGRFLLESDRSLNESARQLIRRRLAGQK